jgi:hypothetical protein
MLSMLLINIVYDLSYTSPIYPLSPTFLTLLENEYQKP